MCKTASWHSETSVTSSACLTSGSGHRESQPSSGERTSPETEMVPAMVVSTSKARLRPTRALPMVATIHARVLHI